MRDPLTGQLHHVAKAQRIRSLGALAAGFALHQSGIFDAASQPMRDDLIFPIDHRFQLLILPDQQASIALFWLLQHEAQPGIVTLVLETGEPTATTLEAHAAGFTHTHAVECPVGAGGERLGQHRIQVLG